MDGHTVISTGLRLYHKTPATNDKPQVLPARREPLRRGAAQVRLRVRRLGRRGAPAEQAPGAGAFGLPALPDPGRHIVTLIF